MSIFLANLNSSTFGKVGGSLLDELVSNNCTEDGIIPYIHVGRNPIPQEISKSLHHFQALLQ